MSSKGSVIVRVFTSDAYLPLAGAAVVLTQPTPDGRNRVLAFRKTNSSGLTSPVPIDTPGPEVSLQPNAGTPYSTVDIRVSCPGHSRAEAIGVQVFPDTQTVQAFQLRPINPSEQGETAIYPEPAQNL